MEWTPSLRPAQAGDYVLGLSERCGQLGVSIVAEAPDSAHSKAVRSNIAELVACHEPREFSWHSVPALAPGAGAALGTYALGKRRARSVDLLTNNGV